jgi:hypothetical protein
MAHPANHPQQEADNVPAESRLEYWLKVVPLIVGGVSGIFAFIPQTSYIFGPFDYIAEALLIICVAGIIGFSIGLVRTKASNNTPPQSAIRQRRMGWILIIAAPLLAGVIWHYVLPLSPAKEEIVQREIALGDTELQIFHNPSGARDHYRNALLVAPRRGSIRVKIQDAEERMRLKGE